MLHKTHAIVIKYIKYKESSIIVKIYTELFGLQSYIVNGVRSDKAKFKIALFQPLSLLDMVVYHKDKKNTIQRISEVKSLHPFESLLFDMKKIAVAMFVAEVINKCVKEEEENPELFHFLKESVIYLDTAKAGYENFSLQFLLKLSKYLGFMPESSEEIFIQLIEHKAFRVQLSYFSKEQVILDELMNQSYEDCQVGLSSTQRRDLINYLLLYYQLHLEDFGQLKSLGVLREILS